VSGGNRRHRVLVVINDLAAGGAQRVALDQSAGLDPDRFEVELMSLELKPARPGPLDRHRHVPIRRLGAFGDRWARLGLALVGPLRRFRPHLVHGHLVAAGIAAAVGARLQPGPRVVVTFHNLTDWEEKRGHPLRVLGRRAFRWCDAMVAVSQAVREAMARVDPGLARRAHVIPNGVDLASFAAAASQRAAARARNDYRPQDFVVGSVARLDPRKGLDVLVEAISIARPRLPDVRLRLVGAGPERERLERQVESLGLRGCVQFAGERTEVASELATMDLFAIPSRTEGQGVAAIEALAAGVPVVGSRVGGIPEVVTEGVCGRLVEAGSPERLAEAIVELATNPEELGRLARNAPQRARAFSLAEGTRRLERLFDTLLEPQEERAAA
jgi:glycosyltransferase involved in cell wall biosynthesis